MSGSFLSNFSLTVVLNLLIKLFWVFVIEVTVQRTLGAVEYGIYFESFNFGYLFFILLDLGLSNYTNRTVAGDPVSLKTLFPSILSIKLALTLVYIFVLYVATLVMKYDVRHTQVVMIIGLNHVLMSMMLFFRSAVGGLHLFKTDAVLSVLDRLVMGVLCSVLLWVPFANYSFDLNSYLYVMTVGYGGSMLIAFFVVARQGVGYKLTFKLSVFRDFLKKSYPFALLFFLMGLYTRIDSVMLGRLLDDGEFHVGIYASAFRLLDAAIIFAVLLSGLLLPMFSRMISKNEPVNSLVKESFNVVLIPAVLLPLGAYFYSDYLYGKLYKEHLEYGAMVFGLLFFNFIPMAMGYIFGTLLTAKSELKLLNLISVAGLIINVVLNALLIPKWEAMGAVAATIATQSLVTLSTFFFSIRYFRLPVYEFIHFRVIGYGLLNLLIFYLLQKYWENEAAALLSSLVLGLVLVPVFRIIRLSDLKQIAKSARPAS